MTQPFDPNPRQNVPPPLGNPPPIPAASPYAPQSLNYQAPVQQLGYGTICCPNCGDRRAKKVGFTWWGGIVGPKLLKHVKCLNCGSRYNGKTGKSNTTAIIIYMAVAFGITIAIFAFAALSGFFFK